MIQDAENAEYYLLKRVGYCLTATEVVVQFLVKIDFCHS